VLVIFISYFGLLQNSTVISFPTPTNSANFKENPIYKNYMDLISSYNKLFFSYTLVSTPTGIGKSGTYTLAGILMQGLCVVIEPLNFIKEEHA
jgi:hypothetical protein